MTDRENPMNQELLITKLQDALDSIPENWETYAGRNKIKRLMLDLPAYEPVGPIPYKPLQLVR